jgi:hypothetical protein
MKIENPILVGFFPKPLCRRPDGFRNSKIAEICSVTNCIANGPKDWISKWGHNSYGFYENEETIDRIFGKTQDTHFIYAYKLYSLIFTKRNVEALEINVDIKQSISSYEFLGFDVVSKSVSDFFECSPLSCNGLCDKYSVNKYCLIDKLEDAYECCSKLHNEKCEPGPYYLFEVHRRKNG